MQTELRENYDGTPWHGTALRPMLDDVDPAAAFQHPIPHAHSIAELLAHVTAWYEIAARRLAGEVFEITEEMDFPPVAGVPWPALISRLESAHARLLEVMATADLDADVAGKPYDGAYMLRGLMHHNTYHAAQIALLKKMQR